MNYIISLLWIVIFSAIFIYGKISFALFTLIILAICFSLLAIKIARLKSTKNVNQLKQQLSEINENNIITKKIDIRTGNGNNQFAEITTLINKLIACFQTAYHKLEQEDKQLIQRLEKQNSDLERKAFETKSSKQNINTMNQPDVINHLAHYDPLTSLPNQIFFNEILNKTINRSKRHNKLFAILILSIKENSSNDSFEHPLSDNIIKIISAEIQHTLRSEDIIAQLGGGEFIILLNDIGKSKFASTVAEKLLHIFLKPAEANDTELNLICNIGICIYPNDGQSLETLLNHVNEALYKATQLGRNTYQFYAQDMDLEAREYINIGTALREAIKNNELSLYYQPKLHIKRGHIIGVESLIRWSHPKYGLVSPSKIISLAEESNLIMQIGEWTLLEACKTNKYWQKEGYEHITIGVNLSPKQFYHPELIKILTKVLEDTQLNPRYLELEINEITVMSDMEKAESILDQIRSTGAQLSLDHFGTGYTSISHLKKFPIGSIKIDPNFIKGLPNNPNDLAITHAIILLAHDLGLEVVAEGVETAEQVETLTSQNCDVIQGYFLSHPLPAQQIILQFKKLMDKVMI